MATLVTGAGGFVGRSVVRALRAKGAPVVAIDANLSMFEAERGLRLVEGDLVDPAVRRAALDGEIRSLIHLAAVPGGAAEADPGLSRRVNIDATLDLLEEAARAGKAPRVVFASTIAVFGDPLPAEGVDDATPLAPRMIYGAHKAMMEVAVATLSRRGQIDGVSLRLPGILARPKGPSGMKSAFMSDLFHAMAAGEPFVSPVSPGATMWLMSVERAADNILHALTLDTAFAPPSRALTLPALRVTMQALAQAVADATKQPSASVAYRPDAVLEAGFGAQPPLKTPAADRAGFVHDGGIQDLVARALKGITTG